jgi:hypothetical protein
MERWLRRIQPFSHDVFEKAISPGGAFALPAHWQKDVHAKRLLAEVTGRIPREMEHLKRAYETGNAKTPTEWALHRADPLEDDFRKFLAKPENQQRLAQFRKFLEIIFSPRYATRRTLSQEARYLYDTGLIFYDEEERCYKCTCQPAEQVMLGYYYETKALTPISSAMAESEQGHLFEDWVESQLFSGTTLPTFPLGNPSEEITVEVPQIMLRKFFTTKNIPKNETGFPCFYVPSVFNFPGWDLVIHDPKTNSDRLIFIQHSINSIRKHDKKKEGGFKIANTFESHGENEPCLVQSIVGGITGIIMISTDARSTNSSHQC